MHHDLECFSIFKKIINEGHEKTSRPGTDTLSYFGQMKRFDISGGKIPLLTTKKIFHRSIIHEMLWFISGSTDIRYLKENNVSIWDSWVIPETAEYIEYEDPFKRSYEFQTEEEHSKFFSDNQEFIISNRGPHQKEGWVPVTTGGSTSYENPKMYDALHEALDKLGVPRKKLVAGSIGNGAYGAMWRKWEDTRIVHCGEEEKYEAKGYTVLGPLDANYKGEGYCAHSVMYRKIDQIANAIELLRTNPDSRRIIVSAWNPSLVEETALPPCHSLFQFWTRKLSFQERVNWMKKNSITLYTAWFDGYCGGDREWLDWMTEGGVPERALSCLLYCRSQDVPVGSPFNIAQYALLTHMVAQCTNMVADEFIWVGGDTHIYDDQMELVKKQMSRTPFLDTVPTIVLDPTIKEIDDFKFEHIRIEGYDNHHPAIKYPVAV